MHLALNRACCRSAIRLATLPPSHPLSKPVNRAAKRYVKSHRSPLHELFHYTQISPSTMEKILPTRRRPNFTPAFSTSIADSRHEAIEEAKKLHTTRQVRIYSDGSLYEGGVGASAVLYLGNRFQKSLTYHLGPEHHHTVYEAEIVGLLLGTHLLSSLSRRLHNPIICIDNQPSIRALANQKPHPAHYLLDHLHDATRLLKLKERNKPNGITDDFSLHLTWTPGHENILENEHADKLAKEAAKGLSSPRCSLPPPLRKPLPISASATKQHLFHNINSQWKSSWSKSTRFEKTKHFYPSPSQKHLQFTRSLSRRYASLLIQARSGHIPLNQYLHRINKAPSPECPHCKQGQMDTPQHVLLSCPKNAIPRNALLRKFGRSSLSLPFLLSHKPAIPHALKILAQTERLHPPQQPQASIAHILRTHEQSECLPPPETQIYHTPHYTAPAPLL
jgi:ribonuclease HI